MMIIPWPPGDIEGRPCHCHMIGLIPPGARAMPSPLSVLSGHPRGCPVPQVPDRQAGVIQQHGLQAQCGNGCWRLIVHETNREKRTRRQVPDTGPVAGEARRGAGKVGTEVTQEWRGPEGKGARCRQSQCLRPAGPVHRWGYCGSQAPGHYGECEERVISAVHQKYRSFQRLGQPSQKTGRW